MTMIVQHFFDPVTSTFSYVVSDSATSRCAIIDPVLDFDYASGTLSTGSADLLIAYVRENGLAVDCILETHIHADHLSSAPYIKTELGGDIAIGAEITTIQNTFGDIFNEDEGFRRDGSQFDRIMNDGDTFMIGGLQAEPITCPVIRLPVWPIVSKTHFLSAIRFLCPMPAQHDAISREEMHRPYSRLVSDYCPCLPTQKSTFATTTSPAGETWLLWRQWASTESAISMSAKESLKPTLWQCENHATLPSPCRR